MASRAILRRKRNLFDSTVRPHTFIRGFSSYENCGSSNASNSWDWCSTVTHQPQNADNKKERKSNPLTENELLKVRGKRVLSNSSEIPVSGLRVGRYGSLSPLGTRWITDQQRYSTAAAGQPDFGKGNDKDEEPTVRQKKEASPEECDEAVEDLTMAKAKAKAKQLQDSQNGILPILKKIWAVLLGIGPALRAVASMSREDWAKKMRHWKDEFKSTMQHYWLGTKLLWADVRICSRLLLKTANGKSLSRRERQQLTRTTADIFRLVPVAVFIIVPFMEFLLPVFLAVFPNMLPSTFQDKMKEEEALKRKLNARIEYAKFLQETVKEMAKEVKNSRSGELKNTAEDLDEFMNKVRRGASVSNEEILGFAKLFNDELTLDNISRPRLVNMCKYMGINPFGTDAYLRFMLRKRLQKIKNDDKMIKAEGVESLSEDELRQACRERGLLGLLSIEEMRQQLRDWLDLSLNHSVPSSLLILSRAFTVSGKVKPEEAVQATLSSLPDEVVDTVQVTSMPSEDSLAERKRKLEFLEMEEELIKEEEEEEEEEQAKMKEKQKDVALEEMTLATAKEAEELKKTKTLDQQEQLCELSRALAVLASASSVSLERHEFLRLVKKEIELYNSMVDKGGPEGEEEARKAYKAAREEDTDHTKERTVDDKVSSALINRVDVMLQKLEKEIDDVDAKIGNRWRLLDRDYDGKVTPEEVASAAAYLKDTLAKEGIQELIANLSKDREGKILVQDLVKLASEIEDAEEETTEEEKAQNSITAAMAAKAQRSLSSFYTRRHFTVAGDTVAGTRSRAASKIGNLLVVASIAKALTAPGGTRNLEKYDDSIPLSENLVLQILRRNVDAATKLDFFKWCSLRPNFKHSTETYSQMFRSICYYNSHNHREDIFILLNSMKQDGVSLNSATFKLLLDSFTRAGNFNYALEILEFMESALENSNNNCLSPDVYNSVLIALVTKNQVNLALSIFLKLLETNDGNGNIIGISDAVACNVLLVGLKRANMRDEFKQVFDKLRGKKNIFPLDRWGYNICIHAFGCWGDLSSCLSLFKEMKERGSWFSPDLCTYNSLIHVLCLLGKVKDALVVWEELKGSSVLEPDVYTYRIVIQGCSKAYLINDAIKVFSEMQYNGIRPDTIIYNSLLDGLLKARKLTDACNLFQKMIEDDGVRASCWTYNILIDGLLKNGRALAAYTLFCDLKKKSNNFVDGVTYSIVILHLCQEGRLDEALKLVEEMEARGFTVDLVTITSLLIAIYREGHWDYTERLVKHVRENNLVPIILRWKDSMEATMKAPQSREKDFTPIFPSNGNFGDILRLEDLTDPETDTALGAEDERDPWSSSPYMDLLTNKASSQSHATRVFSLTGGKRVDTKGADSFDIDMVNTFLSIFLAKGNLSMACKLFEIFTDIGADPVSFTYNSMMGSFVKKGYFNQAWGVLQKMDKKVCPADVATYNVIIQGLGKMGRADLAGAVLDKLMKQGGYLDIVMYNTLINALGKAGRIEEVNKLFQQMKDSGINPDVVTYNTLIEVHAKAGQLKQAYKFLRMMLEAGCAPNHVTDTTLDFLEKEIEKLRYQKASIKRPNVDNSL